MPPTAPRRQFGVVRDDTRVARVTRRQLEIAREFLLTGDLDSEIADRLGVSRTLVNRTLRLVCAEAGVRDKTRLLVAIARGQVALVERTVSAARPLARIEAQRRQATG